MENQDENQAGEAGRAGRVKRVRRSAAEWVKLKEECLGSGMSRWDFARRKGICYTTLSRWFRGGRLRKAVKFKAVDTRGVFSMGLPLVEVVLGGGKAVKIYRECDPGFLKDLLGMV